MTDFRSLARTTAETAAQLALTMRREGVEVAATKSSPIDIVTHADRATEVRIRELLAEARPDDGVLGEEDGATAGTSGYTWVIDPIDGTVNYLYDIPSWSVSIALVEGEPDPASWRLVAGAVANPVTGETFSAGAGEGAFLGDRRIRIPAAPALDRALVTTGFHYTEEVRSRQIPALARLLPAVRDIRRMGSAALDMCAVALGRQDAYYEEGLQPWDLAAAQLIVEEAGGVVTGLAGAAPGRRMTIAGAPSLVTELDALLQDAGA